VNQSHEKFVLAYMATVQMQVIFSNKVTHSVFQYSIHTVACKGAVYVFKLLSFFQRSSASDPELQDKLTFLAHQALERAESLKGIVPQLEEKPTSHVSVQPKLCPVPEHTSASVTVRATAAANRGKVAYVQAACT
jgi:hypothetical protein